MTLTLKVGKRYVRRDGDVTAPLTKYDSERYPFLDPINDEIYTDCGAYYYEKSDGGHDYDLVREYKPAKPEWRVVIKCSTRTHARLIAALLKEKNPRAKITVEKSS